MGSLKCCDVWNWITQETAVESAYRTLVRVGKWLFGWLDYNWHCLTNRLTYMVDYVWKVETVANIDCDASRLSKQTTQNLHTAPRAGNPTIIHPKANFRANKSHYQPKSQKVKPGPTNSYRRWSFDAWSDWLYIYWADPTLRRCASQLHWLRRARRWSFVSFFLAQPFYAWNPFFDFFKVVLSWSGDRETWNDTTNGAGNLVRLVEAKFCLW